MCHDVTSSQTSTAVYPGFNVKFFFFFFVGKCKHFGQIFNQLSASKEHEQSHTGMKSYTCKYCEKCFSKLQAHQTNKRHEQTHLGGKPYTCKHCTRCFSYLSNCKQHERTHTGETPYTCKHCKKCFSQSSHCKQHKRTHTGEKPYTCKHCKKCFSQSPSYKKHEKRPTRASSLKQKEYDHCLKPRRDLQEQAATLGGKKSCMLSSITEENSSQVESLTCWISLKEFSGEACVIQHYDEHMRSK